MSDEFQVRKISQETLGEYLLSVRGQLGLTIEEVANQTGIFEKFISALETGKYQQLPPDVYVLGFLKKISELYKVSCTELLEQYKKEKGISEQTAREKIVPPTGWRVVFSNITVTPKLITLASGAFLGFGALLYILLQVFSVNRTPSLVVVSPNRDSVVQGSSVEVKGQTDPGMSLTVNGQTVLVNSDGTFTTMLGVTPGQKEFRLVATNKFGKEKVELLSLKIDEPTVAGEVTQKPADLELELKFTKLTTILVKRDGVMLPEEQVPAGAVKRIVASDAIELTTSDAGNTQATLNGQQLGALGKAGQSMTIPFTHTAQEFLKEQNSEAQIKAKQDNN